MKRFFRVLANRNNNQNTERKMEKRTKNWNVFLLSIIQAPKNKWESK